ncbi:hypothetical protein DEU56DRAFT_954064 [Suillus clintonianus]|uniref:uncharacterized protein n=1 Tax=Suillus clintonianus TaxID=1904413 RepID=UPI001B8640ED|nr:uncharacterized protein DEU56DRAFT_954064 [Suillus clintonianus]KAG2131015.1 hypothetical protein DEU56DRAFT_954064 [Suillus clintonianus]
MISWSRVDYGRLKRIWDFNDGCRRAPGDVLQEWWSEGGYYDKYKVPRKEKARNGVTHKESRKENKRNGGYRREVDMKDGGDQTDMIDTRPKIRGSLGRGVLSEYAGSNTVNVMPVDARNIDLGNFPFSETKSERQAQAWAAASFCPSTSTTTTTTVAATAAAMATTTARVSNEHRMISKHTPVPFLLEAFPVPPSHIPPSPAVSPVSPSNPPPSLPPTAPLPPVPGPSPLSECDTILFIQNARRPSSNLSIRSIRSVSSSSSDPHSPITRTRTRNGSLSSLRSFHSATGTLVRNPSYDLAQTISEEGPYNVHPQLEPAPLLSASTTLRDIPDVLKPSFTPDDNFKSDQDTLASFPSPPSTIKLKTPRKLSRASELAISFPTTDRPRSTSPDVSAIIQATPRPRSRPRSRVSSHSRPRAPNVTDTKSRSRANSLNGYRSSGSSKHLPQPRQLEVEVEDEDARDSDSSIDLHTPLPHLMLRHGLLSPHSKLLPTSPPDPSRLSIASNFSQASLQSNFSTFSNQSDVSLVTNSSTGSKHPKDSRDTPSRRVRHRDGRLLRGGIGLTTGLGWSDSEDEDAPSPLTRRLSALNLSRRSSAASISTSHSYSSLRSPHPLSRSISHSILREEEDEDDVDDFGRVVRTARTDYGHVIRDGPFSKSLPLSGSRTQPLNLRSSKPRPHKPKDDARVPLEDELGLGMDGVTPTRAEFRDSAGSSSSGLGTGTGTGNGSSTASTSSLSLPFPATPQSPMTFSSTSPNALSPTLSSMGSNHTTLTLPPSRSSTPSSCNIDKSLPPLPLTPKKYPPSLSRLRSYSSVSSIGSVELGSGGDEGLGMGTPRPSLGGVPRPSLGSVPRPSLGGVPRPSLGGVPRPSLGVPRPSLSGTPRPSLGGVPRPSLSTPRPSMSSHPSASNTSLSTPNPSVSSLAAQNGHGGVSSVPFVSTTESDLMSPRDFTNPRDITSITIPRDITSSRESGLTSPRESGPQSPLPRPLKLLQPGEQPPRPGGVLMYNRNVHDQLKRTQTHSQSQPQSPVTQTLPMTPVMRTLVMPGSVGMGSKGMGNGGNGDRPKSRTGTGMVYRSSSGPVGSRMRVPSAVRPSGVGVAL